MKKVLSIVLAVCMLAGLCVGLSLSGSADVTIPVKPADAKNYAETVELIKNGGDAVDNGDGTITLTSDGYSSSPGFASYALEGLEATDDYVMSFSMQIPAWWGGANWCGKVYLTDSVFNTYFHVNGEDPGFFDVNGNRTAYANPGLADGETVPIVVYAKYDEATATRTYYLWMKGNLLGTFEGMPASDPHLMAGAPRQGGLTVTLSNMFVYKVEEVEETTTSTTTTTTTQAAGDETTTTEGTTTTQKPTGVVDGVDLDKKGTGKDEVIKGFETTGKNLADSKNTTVEGNAEIAKDGTVTVPSSAIVKYDLGNLTASDDFVIKFTLATSAGWPHSKSYLVFGTNEDGTETHTATIRGNLTYSGITYEFPWVYASGDTAVDLRVPSDNTTQDIDYTIFVTTSKETGLRRIFFFANGKLFKVQTAIDKAEKDVEIKDQKCLTPTLIFKNDYVDYPTVYKNVEVYKAKVAEPKVDKTYTTPPIAKAGAKNYVDLSKATAKGSGVVDAAAGKFLTGTGADSSVTIPLKGLKKTDSYVVSFMTQLCDWDPWQALGIVVAQDGDKKIGASFMGARLPGNDTFSVYYDSNISEQRLQSISNMGQMTKIDILVTNSVETGKRRVIIFQDGKIMQTYSPTPSNWDYKSAEALTPVLVFTAGGFSHEINNLKVFKLSDAKGESGSSGSAGTGNASTAVAAVAVTAAIALPVIFVAKKKRKEEE